VGREVAVHVHQEIENLHSQVQTGRTSFEIVVKAISDDCTQARRSDNTEKKTQKKEKVFEDPFI
jgi:acyl-CoA hydrolase